MITDAQHHQTHTKDNAKVVDKRWKQNWDFKCNVGKGSGNWLIGLSKSTSDKIGWRARASHVTPLSSYSLRFLQGLACWAGRAPGAPGAARGGPSSCSTRKLELIFQEKKPEWASQPWLDTECYFPQQWSGSLSSAQFWLERNCCSKMTSFFITES